MTRNRRLPGTLSVIGQCAGRLLPHADDPGQAHRPCDPDDCLLLHRRRRAGGRVRPLTGHPRCRVRANPDEGSLLAPPPDVGAWRGQGCTPHRQGIEPARCAPRNPGSQPVPRRVFSPTRRDRRGYSNAQLYCDGEHQPQEKHTPGMSESGGGVVVGASESRGYSPAIFVLLAEHFDPKKLRFG